jgi:hypothetical protein
MRQNQQNSVFLQRNIKLGEFSLCNISCWARVTHLQIRKNYVIGLFIDETSPEITGIPEIPEFNKKLR